MANWTDKDLRKKGYVKKDHSLGIQIDSSGNVGIVSRGIPVSDSEMPGLDLLNNRIFIPGEVRSSKNSRRLKIVKKRLKSGETKTVPISENSDASKRYMNNTCWYYKLYANWFLKMAKDKPLPLLVEFQFVRSKHECWDFANMVQLPQDMMSTYGWIEDDDKDIMLPIPNIDVPYTINPNCPGVWIKILDKDSITYNNKK